MSRRLVMVLGLALSMACGGDKPVGPVAGELTLSLTTPHLTDGAVMLQVAGPIEMVIPVGTYRVEAAPLAGGLTRIIVTGTITNGPLVRIRVPDVNAAAIYLAIVEQAAHRQTFALLSVTEYKITVAP